MNRMITKMKVVVVTCLIILMATKSFAMESIPRPGEVAPEKESARLILFTNFHFATALSTAKAGIENAIENDAEMQYTFTLKQEELLKVGGISLVQERFSEKDPIVLWISNPIKPGEIIDTIQLSPLPNGSSLPQGIYDGEMHVTLFDRKTHNQKLGTFLVAITINIKMEKKSLFVDGQKQIKDFTVYNGTSNDVQYLLVVSALQLHQIANLTQYHSKKSKFTEEDTMIILAKHLLYLPIVQAKFSV